MADVSNKPSVVLEAKFRYDTITTELIGMFLDKARDLRDHLKLIPEVLRHLNDIRDDYGNAWKVCSMYVGLWDGAEGAMALTFTELNNGTGRFVDFRDLLGSELCYVSGECQLNVPRVVKLDKQIILKAQTDEMKLHAKFGETCSFVIDYVAVMKVTQGAAEVQLNDLFANMFKETK